MASGASSASQRAIGTTVFWGMLIGTVLAVFLVPLFYVVVRKFFKGSAHERERAAEAGITHEMADKYLHDAETGSRTLEHASLTTEDESKDS